ncbi:hypothetical protein GC089_15295 [Cellulomonas sp. JZ18]|uniref:flagellar hook-length control protein FliK n=1 Tax=Cellulomonas sp. JZ18 TaxID=2654191 RepID=UPI0012D4B59E|nr:flagellar hook-length control protein FliK [Cellulomonas sp. JZ18]QGQ20302.1 hypothetical protein GC089_15295 [Cellulomonas sp. JZ18]
MSAGAGAPPAGATAGSAPAGGAGATLPPAVAVVAPPSAPPAAQPADPAPDARPTSSPEPPPVAEQLGARVRSLGLGRHVLSVPLDPEHLGAARVVAHVTGDTVRVDLAGATDVTREALRASLADLRRDLQQAGLQVDVGLSGEPRQQGSGRPDAQQRDGAAGTRPGGTPTGAAAPATSAPAVPAHGGTLDLVV